MLESLVEACSGCAHLTLGAFTIGLGTKTPLDNDSMMQGLAGMQTRFSVLSESKYDKEKDTFKLLNDEPEIARQMLFKLARKQSFDFAWGHRADFGSEADIDNLFDCWQDEFSLYSVNVGLVDFQMHMICNLTGHHYGAMWEAFFSKTPLGGLCGPDLLLQADIHFRSLLDPTRVCVVLVESDVADEEVRRGKFENDHLRAKIGIAQTKIPLDARFSMVAKEHMKTAMKFIESTFLPSIAVPLDQALAEMAQEGERCN